MHRPALLPFSARAVGNAHLWVRGGYDEALPRLVAAWEGEAEEWIGGGRAPHPVVPLADGGRAVVRRFRRGGMVRHLNRDRYFGGNRAAEELRATEAARAGGVNAPEVIAAGRRPAAPGYRAMIATRLIPGVRDAAAALAGADGTGRFKTLWEAGRQIGRMHAAGVAHPDLNLRNLLVAAPDVVWLIDFDGARVTGGVVPRPRRARDLARLARSATKLRLPLSPADQVVLRDGYLSEMPLLLDLG